MPRRLVVSLWIAVVVACSLFTVDQAEATTITCNPCSLPYQTWADESKMPTPEVTIRVIEEPCPGLPAGDFAWACTEWGTATIWDAAHDRETFLHELGHNFDYYRLPHWARGRFLALTEDTRDWKADPNGPDENFAATYAHCAATGPRFYGDPGLQVKGNGAAIRQTTYRAICRMVLGI